MREGDPIVGVIGGAGVGAAARLYELVGARVRERTGALPRLVLWNLPLSDAIEGGFTAAQPDPRALAAVEEMLAEAFERLLAAGATVVAMPCNTLARAAAREAARHCVPFVDMIEATVRAAGGERAVLISTDATRAGGIYDGFGVEMLTPAPETLHESAALIRRAVSGDLPAPAQMRALVEGAAVPGASVVLGCTDICGLLDPADAERLRVVESLGALAGAVSDALLVPA